MAKASETIRTEFMELLRAFLIEKGEEVLQVKTGTLSIPWAREEEEGYINITFSIPKGERGGGGYDGHSEAENFKFEQAAKAEKAKEAKAKREAKAKKDAEKRAEKAAKENQ